MRNRVSECRAWERLCREQAARADTGLARQGLEKAAELCRLQAEAFECCFPSVLNLGSKIGLRYWSAFIKFLLDLFPAITWRSSPAWCSSRCARCWR
jgi:hypothetical protein